jgi:hypothetical protein
MSISHTANKAIARQVVDRLCRKPPYGQCRRDYAIKEISCALDQSTGGADAAASC